MCKPNRGGHLFFTRYSLKEVMEIVSELLRVQEQMEHPEEQPWFVRRGLEQIRASWLYNLQQYNEFREYYNVVSRADLLEQIRGLELKMARLREARPTALHYRLAACHNHIANLRILIQLKGILQELPDVENRELSWEFWKKVKSGNYK